MTDCPACDIDHPRGSSDCPGRRVGTVFNGKYELVRVLGCGGMGAVYEAVHKSLGRRSAVKIMLQSAAGRETAAQRFEAEARRVAALDHPGIVKIHDAGRDADGTLFLEMELLAGESLEAWAGTRPAVAACVDAIAAALDGLAVAHAAGVVHRDLKPDNIFVANGGRRIVLLDFGIARGDDSASTTKTREGTVLGTLAYMSPEQFADASTADARADVFAMAATLYRLLVGKPPLDGTRAEVIVGLASADYPRSLRAAGVAASPVVERAVAAALDPDPQKRPRDAAAFRAMLVARATPAETELEADIAAPHASAARPAAVTEVEDAAPSPTAQGEPASAAPSEAIAPHARRRWPLALGGLALVGAGVPIALHFAGGSASPPPAAVQIAKPPIDAAPPPIDGKATVPDLIALDGGTVELGVGDPVAFVAHCKTIEKDGKYCEALAKRIEPGRVTVAPFELARDEVTRADFARWLDGEVAHGAKIDGERISRADGVALAMAHCQGAGGLVIADGHVAPDGNTGQRAAACMTFVAAEAYCAARHERLPTSAEYVVAARQRAPAAPDADRCDAGVFDNVPHGSCEMSPLGPQHAGTKPGDITTTGVRDLAGNVAEWVDTPARDGKHLARGGDWANGEIDLDPAKLQWIGVEPGRPVPTTISVGFRCARSK